MKKVLLLIFSLFIGIATYAYETVIVEFPDKERWESVFYQTQGNETILQYVPRGQTDKNWNRAVIFHSYKPSKYGDNAAKLLDVLTSEMEHRNPTQKYRYTKYTYEDSIATRCTNATKYAVAQCEILRSSASHEGIITMHYINKNRQNFRNTYSSWYKIIKEVKIYYSYWRNDRVLNKATIFEI